MLTLTDPAAAKVKELIVQEGDDSLMLRVAVHPGGCSGFSYEMFFDSQRDDRDLTAQFGAVTVVVDQDSAQLLTGATLDYSDAPSESGFAITNPNPSSTGHTCGCGKSDS